LHLIATLFQKRDLSTSMELYSEKCLELVYERRERCRGCTDKESCPTRKDLEHVMMIVKQLNNAELAEYLELNL
jgi:hypothetical protein